MSNLGRWDWYYRRRGRRPFGYSESPVFEMGADWLADCTEIADWGCGGGLLRRHVAADRYIGVDGSHTWAASVTADLETYRAPSDGLFMRHVLEHNYGWRTVLDNAVASFGSRMVLVLFTPWLDSDDDERVLQIEERYEVPTISFRRGAIEERLDGLRYELQEVPAGSFYGTDHLYLIER